MVVPARNVSTWYRMTAMQVARELQVDPAQGLSAAEAAARLKRYGPNLLAAEKKSPEPKRWVRLSWLVIPAILFVGSLLSLFFSTNLLATLILCGLTILSIYLGVYPEIEAGNHGTPAETLCKEIVRVRRSGQVVEIDAAKIVPGDIVVVTTGDRVPADGRLYIAARLQIDESALDGGSNAARKEIGVLENSHDGPGTQTNMAFMQTTVTNGYGAMIVTSTGTKTQIGRTITLNGHGPYDQGNRDGTQVDQSRNDQDQLAQKGMSVAILMRQHKMPVKFAKFA